MVDRGKLYRDSEDFFRLGGSVTMRLTRAAACEVCEQAAAKGILVARIEGGVWQDPGFESRLDAIWDGADPPISTEDAHQNNLAARAFVEKQPSLHTAFILTAPPISGWPHKARS